jgi:type IV pilus assembly protein PilA
MKMELKGRTQGSRRAGAGFSLIELLVAMAVMMTIMAIAIPQILRAKLVANEASAVASLRTITTAEIAYQTSYGQGFSPSLKALGPPPGGGQPTPASADLIDSVLGSGIKNGYSFVYAAISAGGVNPEEFTVNANPISPGQTGVRFFFVDQTNVIRWSAMGPAGPGDMPMPK